MKPITSLAEKNKVEAFLSPKWSEGCLKYLGRTVFVNCNRFGWMIRDLFIKHKFKWRNDAYVQRRIDGFKVEVAKPTSESIKLQILVQKPCIPSLAEKEASFGIHMNEIVPGLFLGDQTAAGLTDVDDFSAQEDAKKKLESSKITHILSCTTAKVAYFPEQMTYEHIEIGDKEETDISIHFNKAFEFIEKALSQGAVLVHCSAGASRSASMVISYIMRKYQVSFDKSYNFVRSKRPIVEPNPGFIKQLQQYEHALIDLRRRSSYLN